MRSFATVAALLVGALLLPEVAAARPGFLKKARRSLRRARQAVERTAAKADAIAVEVDSTMIAIEGLAELAPGLGADDAADSVAAAVPVGAPHGLETEDAAAGEFVSAVADSFEVNPHNAPHDGPVEADEEEVGDDAKEDGGGDG
jgi:hypothetical protein